MRYSYFLIGLIGFIALGTNFAFADHATATVSVPSGSSVSGCEETNECYIPYEVTIDVGGEVTWVNDDSAAHTVTSGTPADGPDGVFDSSLFMSGAEFSLVFGEAGTFNYFCMVHPWMEGIVVVQAAGAEGDEHIEGDLMVDITTGQAGTGERLSIDVTFTKMDGSSVEHVNYDIMATQGNEFVLDDTGVHDHDGVMNHMTAPLPMAASSDSPVNVEVTFNGFGIPGEGEFTGPVGKVATKQVVVQDSSSKPDRVRVTVDTDKSSYDEGDTIRVSGTVSYVLDDVPISLKITAPNGNIVTTSQIQVKSDGSFRTSLTAGGSLMRADGTYVVTVLYRTESNHDETTFSFQSQPDLPTPIAFLSISTDKSEYRPGEFVTVNIRSSGSSNVAISVTDSSGNNIVTRSIHTDKSDQLQFKLSESSPSGRYTVDATTTISGEKLSDSTSFNVKSSTGNVTIVSVQPTDQQGNAISSFNKGKLAFVKVVLSSDANIESLATVNLFDSDLTSLGIGSFKTTLSTGQSEMILSFFIPEDAVSGNANIYTNVFSDWPSNGGVPLTSEKQASVQIR